MSGYPVAIDASTNEIISGEMPLEDRIKFGYKYSKEHPKYPENFKCKNPFKLGKPERHYSSESDCDSDSELECESDRNSDSDSDSDNELFKKEGTINSKITRRMRTFEIDDKNKKKVKKHELSKKQIKVLKELCNISTIKTQLDEISINCNDYSKSNVTLILSVVDSIITNNSLKKDEKRKIKKLLDEVK